MGVNGDRFSKGIFRRFWRRQLTNVGIENDSVKHASIEDIQALSADFRGRASDHRKKASLISVWILTSILFGIGVIIFLPPIIVASDMALRNYFKIPVISDEINRLQERRLDLLRASERLSLQRMSIIEEIKDALKRPFAISTMNEGYSGFIGAEYIVEVANGHQFVIGRSGIILKKSEGDGNTWERIEVSFSTEISGELDIIFVGRIGASGFVVADYEGNDRRVFTFDQAAPKVWLEIDFIGDPETSYFEIEGIGILEGGINGSLSILNLDDAGKVVRKPLPRLTGPIISASKLSDSTTQIIAKPKVVSPDDIDFSTLIGEYSYEVFLLDHSSMTMERQPGFTIPDSNQATDIALTEGGTKLILFRPSSWGVNELPMQVYAQEGSGSVWTRLAVPRFDGRDNLIDIGDYGEHGYLAIGTLQNNIVGEGIIIHSNDLVEGFEDISPVNTTTGRGLLVKLSAIKSFANGDFLAVGDTFGDVVILLSSASQREGFLELIDKNTSFTRLYDLFMNDDRLLLSSELYSILSTLNPGLVNSPLVMDSRLSEELEVVEDNIENLAENFSNQQSLENIVSGVARFAVLGVLLYFLQTLVNRFRYANRMAAHSESRADVLDLFLALDSDRFELQASVLGVLNAGFSSEHITERNLERDDPLSPQRFVNKIVKE